MNEDEINREIDSLAAQALQLKTQLIFEEMDGLEYWLISEGIQARLERLKYLLIGDRKQAVVSPEMARMGEIAEEFFSKTEKMFEEARRYTYDA